MMFSKKKKPMKQIKQLQYLKNKWKALLLNSEQIHIASKLKSGRDKAEFAKNTLGVGSEEVKLLNDFQRLGAKKFALKYLGIQSENQLKRILKWMKMTRHERIEALIPRSDSSFKEFLYDAYASYRKFKKARRSTWKRHDAKFHMQKVASVLDTCIMENSMSLEQAKKIAMFTYFAMWASINKKENTKVIPSASLKAMVA